MQLKNIKSILFLLIIISCDSVKREKPVSLFTNITFTTGLCYGTCPQTAGYIDDSLNFYFYGGKFAERDSLSVGYYKGKIDNTIWAEVNNKAIRLKKYLDSTWDINIDGSAIEIKFTDSFNKSKRILGDEMMPEKVYSFVKWLQQLSQKLKLKKISDTIFFRETNLKIIDRRLPPPPLKINKFIPPKTKKY